MFNWLKNFIKEIGSVSYERPFVKNDNCRRDRTNGINPNISFKEKSALVNSALEKMSKMECMALIKKSFPKGSMNKRKVIFNKVRKKDVHSDWYEAFFTTLTDPPKPKTPLGRRSPLRLVQAKQETPIAEVSKPPLPDIVPKNDFVPPLGLIRFSPQFASQFILNDLKVRETKKNIVSGSSPVGK